MGTESVLGEALERLAALSTSREIYKVQQAVNELVDVMSRIKVSRYIPRNPVRYEVLFVCSATDKFEGRSID